ncbi:hypothetical protein D3C87_1168200 [compost metagenome]
MKSHPRKAIENGLTAQLMKSVTPMPRQCCLTWPSAPKSTLNSIGMIITHIRIPTGRLTWAISRRPIAWNNDGMICPSVTPSTMQKKTQSVR